MISAMPPAHRAFTLLSALLLGGGASCTSQEAPPTSHASSAQPASTGSSLPAVEALPALPIPPVTSGEISRVVYTPAKTDSVLRGEARTGQQYALEAACVSAIPGRIITYEVLSSKQNSNTPVFSGELPCDGNVIKNSTPLPATAIQISLGPDLSGVTSAYAVITPST